MTLFRTEHKRNYTVTNNYIIKDSRLSWKAKGIWLYAFSRPDDWEFSLCDIIKHSTDGRESIRAGLKELADCGYLQRSQTKENGKFSKAEWVFFETPQELKKCLPKTENPTTANQTTENRPLLSTDCSPSTEPPPNSPPPKKQEESKLTEKAVVELTHLISFCKEKQFAFHENTLRICAAMCGIKTVIEAIRGFVSRTPSQQKKIANPDGWLTSQCTKLKGTYDTTSQ